MTTSEGAASARGQGQEDGLCRLTSHLPTGPPVTQHQNMCTPSCRSKAEAWLSWSGCRARTGSPHWLFAPALQAFSDSLTSKGQLLVG